MKILFLSHTPAGGSFVVGSHHLAKAMAGMGHDVVHMSPPVTPAHLFRAKDPFERKRIRRWINGGERINGFSDVIPAAALPWGVAARLSKEPHFFYGRQLKSSALRLLCNLDMLNPDIVFIDEPRLAAMVSMFKEACVVYRPTDLYADIRNDPTILEAEKYLVRRANKFIATSEPVAFHLKSLGVNEVLVLENGVDLEVFSRGRITDKHVLRTSDKKKAIYVGAFDRRFGFDSVEVAAERLPDVDFILIGPINEAARSKFDKYCNVKFLGAIKFTDLPKYLMSASVAILPLSNDPSNNGRSPMKLYEYAAMGLPVVATSTSELARRNLTFVSLADSAEDFAEKLGALISGKETLEDPRVEVAKHSWVEKSIAALRYSLD